MNSAPNKTAMAPALERKTVPGPKPEQAQDREVQAGPGDARSTPGSASGPHGVVGGQERLEDQARGDPGRGRSRGEHQGLGGEQQAALGPGGQHGGGPGPWLVLPVSGSEGGSAMRASSPVGAFMTVSVLSRQSVAVNSDCLPINTMYP